MFRLVSGKLDCRQARQRANGRIYVRALAGIPLVNMGREMLFSPRNLEAEPSVDVRRNAMSRKWIALAALAGLLLVGIFVWRGQESSEKPAASEASAKNVPARRMGKTVTDLRVADVDTLVADDRVGNVRLEGQVVDAEQAPVAGALVSISSNPRRTAISAEDGSFFFDRLVGRTYSLVATSKEGAAGPVSAQLSERSDPVILHLRPAATVEVTVLTSEDRAPVANATVELRGLMTQSMTTDQAGVAQFRGVAQGFYRVAASAEGYAQSQGLVRIGAVASTFDSELLLRRGNPVSGIVRDTKGAPVQGAQVLYESVGDRFMRADPRFDAQTTDASGGFTFAALPKGTFRFTAQHSIYAPGESEPVTLTAESAADGVTITLEEGASLVGRVLDENGNPAALAAVRVATAGRGRRGGGRPTQVYSQEDGRFEVTGLARKSVSVVALHETATSETLEVDLTTVARQADLELLLGLNGVISGTVSDSTGAPIDGAQVRLRPDFRTQNFSFADMRLRGMASGVSDAGGRFSFHGLGEGTYTVMASPPGSAMQFRGGRGGGGRDGVEAAVGDTEVRIVLEARGSIVGKVAYADGSVPAAFTISMGGRRGASTPFSTKDGAFRIGDLEPGTYEPRLSGSGFQESRIAEVEVVAGSESDVGTIAIAEGRTLRGSVVGPSGEAIENATVIAGARLRGSGTSTAGGGFPGRGGSTKTATSDAEGTFVLRGLGAGSLIVAAEHESKGRSAPLNLAASSESSEGLQLQLLAPGVIEGVVILDGNPADSARVRVQSQDSVGLNFTVGTGADGTYRFDVLAPGKYLVFAEVGNPRTGIAATSKDAVVESDSVTTIDLAMTLGEVALSVTATGDGVDFATVELVEGVVSATSAKALEIALAAHSGASSFTIIFGGQPGKISDLNPGTYSVCVTTFPEGVVGGGSRDYLERVDVPVVCQKVEVAASPLEQAVSIAVTVPEFVPEVSETAP